MELHQLKYFIAVVETGSFSKAANRCFVAQPSLSQQIIKLEKEIGTKLFDRLGKKVVLTETGNALLPGAKRILNESKELKLRMSEEITGNTGALSVGIIPTIAPYILPGVLKSFKKDNPDAVIQVRENLTERLIDMLINFEIDIAIMSLPFNNKLLTYSELFEDRLVLAVPANHKFSKLKKVKLKDLDDVQFIALDEEHCFGEQVKNFCYQKTINPDVVCKTWNLSTITNCVSTEIGVSIIPLMTALTNRQRGTIIKELEENPTRSVVSVSYRQRSKKSIAEIFEKTVMREYEKILKRAG